LLIDSHCKLNCLDDTQELFYTTHPKLAFVYDEDTKSLVEEFTVTTAEILFPTSQISLLGTPPSYLKIITMKSRLMN
jgi:hypothetical protein